MAGAKIMVWGSFSHSRFPLDSKYQMGVMLPYVSQNTPLFWVYHVLVMTLNMPASAERSGLMSTGLTLRSGLLRLLTLIRFLIRKPVDGHQKQYC